MCNMMAYLTTLLLLLILSLLVYLLSFLKNLNSQHTSDSFECGFNSLSNPSLPLNMPFFYITLMFLIFDLELALLIFFPLLNKESSSLHTNTLIILLLIFLFTVYEWEKSLINWF